MDRERRASPDGHSAALLMLCPHASAHACVGVTLSAILAGNATPTPPPPTPPLSPGVMGDEDVSCHYVRDRESLNPGFIISGVAGNWTSAPESEHAARTS